MADADATMGDAPASRLMITKMVLENFKSSPTTVSADSAVSEVSESSGPMGPSSPTSSTRCSSSSASAPRSCRLNKVSELIHRHRSTARSSIQIDVAPQLVSRAHNLADVLDEDGADPENFTIVEYGSELVVSRTAFSSNQSKYQSMARLHPSKKSARWLRRKFDLDNNRFLILQGEVEQIAMMNDSLVMKKVC